VRREARTEEKAVLGVEDLRGDVVEATADDVARVEVQLVPLVDCATPPTAIELKKDDGLSEWRGGAVHDSALAG
jgi:hypothetical protein